VTLSLFLCEKEVTNQPALLYPKNANLEPLA